jgi:hypothetical protein
MIAAVSNGPRGYSKTVEQVQLLFELATKSSHYGILGAGEAIIDRWSWFEV